MTVGASRVMGGRLPGDRLGRWGRDLLGRWDPPRRFHLYPWVFIFPGRTDNRGRLIHKNRVSRRCPGCRFGVKRLDLVEDVAQRCLVLAHDVVGVVALCGSRW